MVDVPRTTPWSDASMPKINALAVGDCVVRSGTTLPIVGVIATLRQDQAYVEWRDGTSDWSQCAALRGAPSWWR